MCQLTSITILSAIQRCWEKKGGGGGGGWTPGKYVGHLHDCGMCTPATLHLDNGNYAWQKINVILVKQIQHTKVQLIV